MEEQEKIPTLEEQEKIPTLEEVEEVFVMLGTLKYLQVGFEEVEGVEGVLFPMQDFEPVIVVFLTLLSSHYIFTQ